MSTGAMFDRWAFFECVIERGALRDEHEGRRAVAAVLPVLSQQLDLGVRSEVAAREGVPVSFGLEHAQAVCQARSRQRIVPC